MTPEEQYAVIKAETLHAIRGLERQFAQSDRTEILRMLVLTVAPQYRASIYFNALTTDEPYLVDQEHAVTRKRLTEVGNWLYSSYWQKRSAAFQEFGLWAQQEYESGKWPSDALYDQISGVCVRVLTSSDVSKALLGFERTQDFEVAIGHFDHDRKNWYCTFGGI